MREQRRSRSRATHLIVGGGAAGCVLANRLSADPANKIVLIANDRRYCVSQALLDHRQHSPLHPRRDVQSAVVTGSKPSSKLAFRA